MIRLYTWTTPNGRKVSIALEELGLAYEVVPVNLGENAQLKPEFLALNPNHKIPVLDDDGLVIWESGAILLHLAEKYGAASSCRPTPRAACRPSSTRSSRPAASARTSGASARSCASPRPSAIPRWSQIFGDEVKRLLGVIDRILSDGRPYLAGEYSIGDIMHYPWLTFLVALKMPMMMELPRVVAWIERIGARPAVQRGMKVPA